jgi:hypothetical protein
MTITNISGNKVGSQQTSADELQKFIERNTVATQQLLRDAGLKVVYSPQSAFSLPGLALIHTHLRKQVNDVAMSKIEGLIALYGALSSTNSSKGFACVLTLYAKTHGQQSITGKLHELTNSLFSGYIPQSSESKPQWISDMSSGLHNWKLLVNSPSFGKISRVLTLLVTLGCIDSQSVTLGNFELFAVKAQERQATATDLFDALFDTVTYFAEGAYQCFLTGSLKPLLFSSSEVITMEEQYINLMTQWEYARNGNLTKFTDSSEAQFDKELTDLVDKLCDLYKTMPNGVEKKIIQQKWEALAKVKTEWVAVRVAGGLRAAPFACKVYGDSGVGKSTFSDLVMTTILKASGVPSTSEFIVTLNESDKYDSNYRSYITGIKLDDYGNAKSQFWEQAPSDQIIKIVNNLREYAVMADIANKGKITIEPKALVVTTNVEQLHAGVSSNNPISVLRRMHHHLELNVRPEYKTNNMLDSNKVIAEFGNLDQVNDIWLVTMKEPVPMAESGELSQQFSAWKIIKKDLSVNEYLNILYKDTQTHVKNQDCITTSFQEPSTLVNFCSECSQLTSTCSCSYEPHFGERIATHIADKVAKTTLDASILKLNVETKLEDLAVNSLVKSAKIWAESPYSSWTSWVPEQWMSHEYVQLAILASGEDYITTSVKQYVTRFIAFTFMMTYLFSCLSYSLVLPVLIIHAFFFMLCYSMIIRSKTNAYMKEISLRRDSLSVAFKSARDQHVQYACGFFAGLAVIYGACKIIKTLKASLTMQGALSPTTTEEIESRDRETNVWAEKAARQPNPFGFSTVEESEKITTSIGRLEVNGQFTGCFMISTNIVAIPAHVVPSSPSKAKIFYRGNAFTFVLNKDFVAYIDNADMVLCYVPNTGPLKDRLRQFLKEPIEGATMATMHGLMPDKTPFKTNFLWCRAGTAIHNGHTTFNGSHYTLKMNTFQGQCMSPILCESQRREILGFHIGGVTGQTRGCGMEILQGSLVTAIQTLKKLNSSTSIGAQASPMPSTIAGRPLITSTDVHRKCPTNFLEGERNISIYGSTTSSSFHASSVIDTPISATVAEVTGQPNLWGPPKFNNPVTLDNGHIDRQKWKPWFESLKYSCTPSGGFDPAVLQWASEDYKSDLFDTLNNQKEYWQQDIRPLTRIETVSGIDGKRFIDAMKSGTSMGLPFNGPKSAYLVDLPATPEHACPRTFKPEIWSLVDSLMQDCDENSSLWVVFLASLKDEPTPLTKDKVRVFQAAPVALQILIRMYFLPIARFLSVNPLLSECAVGINSHGPEWNALAEHMRRFGENRIIAGDFSKYDLSMPEQLTIAANQIFIDIASWSGNYTPVELNRMRVIAHAVCSPVVNFDGTLIRLNGSNPSGQNMTVYTNSVVNSLLHRMSFNDAYCEQERKIMTKQLGLDRPVRFRDICSLSTYGDDAKGSVREGYDKFNHIQMANFLRENGIGFTMPDKESEPKAFMTDDEADFLKRKNRFCPELNTTVGMLDEKSLFKSLHSINKSKVESPLSVSAQNIGSAMREWFFHGREVYDKRRAQMQMIADIHDLPVPELDLSFDDKILEQQTKYGYLPQAGKTNVPEVPYNIEAGSQDDDLSVLSESHLYQSEEELTDEVLSYLPNPIAEEYPIIHSSLGKGDLLYMSKGTFMVVEVKRVFGRHKRFTEKVRDQAIRYGNVMKALFPDCTVYSVIYTEHGFCIVDVQGEPTFPKEFAAVLDAADIYMA